MGGEDLEGMIANYGQLLKALGDVAFAKALQQQRPEVRSAARWFIPDMKSIQHQYPKSYNLLLNAPAIDWPTDRAYRNS